MTGAGRQTLRGAKLCVAVVLALLAAALPAGAKTYDVWSCTDMTTPNARLAVGSWFSQNGAATNYCPDGLWLPSADFLSQWNSTYLWQWNDTSSSEARQVTFTLSGGDADSGVDYELAADQEIFNPPFATFDPQPDGSRVETILVPEGVSTLFFRAVCRNEEGCAGTKDMLFHDIKIRLDDSAPPDLSFGWDSDLNTSPEGETDGPLTWHRKWEALDIGAYASDFASGVRYAAIHVDESPDPLWVDQPQCDLPTELWGEEPPAMPYDRALICEAYTDAAPLLPLNSLAEGRHKFVLSGGDAMGNQAQPMVGWFGIDSVAPAAPDIVEVGATGLNEHGWTSNGAFWANVGAPPGTGPNVAPITRSRATATRDDASGAESIDLNEYGDEQSFPAEGHYRIDGWYVDAAGNRGFSRPAFIGFDRTQPPTPVLDSNEWISRDRLIAGYEQTWAPVVAPADVESDICGFEVKYDKQPHRTLSGPENVSGNVASTTVPASLAEGYNQVHVASVSCAGNVSLTDDQAINVDATDPSVDVENLSPAAWQLQTAAPRLSAFDALSGVAAIYWSVDGGPTESGGPGDETLVLDDGQHTITTWAEDVAGNVGDPETTVVNVDTAGPEAWITPAGSDATKFTAHVIDAVSGLDSAALQIRRVDADAGASERAWRQLGAAHVATGAPSSEQSFTRSIDDSAFADGSYELRVVGLDTAGNIAYGSALLGGTFEVSLPLRPRPAVVLAVSDLVRVCSSRQPRGCSKDNRCRKSAKCTFSWEPSARGAGVDRVVDWGDRVALTGTVLNAGGTGMGGVALKIYSTVPGKKRELVANTTSDGAGEFEWRIPSGPSRLFEVVSAAGDGFSAGGAAANLAVRAGVEFTLSDRSVRSRQKVILTGRIASGSLGLPPGGKRIELQMWSAADDEWRAAIDAPLTSANGRFRSVWNVKPTSARGVVRLRAAALADDQTWPFESGKSRPVRVSVRP